MSQFNPPGEDRSTDLDYHRQAQAETFRARATDDGKWAVLDGNWDERFTCNSEAEANEFITAVKDAVARQIYLQTLIYEEHLRKLRG